MPKSVTNVFVAGVGGQGVLVASEVLARVALASGLDVKKSEVHGMSQRGGSVVSQVRFGPSVFSPLIPEGEVDILIGFEELETLRYLHLVSPAGIVIVNRQKISPLTVSRGLEEYPPDTMERIFSRRGRVMALDASALAGEAGSLRTINTVILGALSTVLPFPVRTWRQVLAKSVPPATIDLNRRAFNLGKQKAEEN